MRKPKTTFCPRAPKTPLPCTRRSLRRPPRRMPALRHFAGERGAALSSVLLRVCAEKLGRLSL